MERLKNMGLKKAFFLLTFCCLLLSLLLAAAVWLACSAVTAKFPSGGIALDPDGTVTVLEQPTDRQQQLTSALFSLQMLSCFLLPACGLFLAGILFYRWKLKKPIAVLQSSAKRIRQHDLSFTVPAISADELGLVCTAFEEMRAELFRTNQELWRQSEERRRLNAAFSHDLRNPVTVLKGTVKLLRKNIQDEQALDRLETYVLRIEDYVEVMSGIQRLEQLPVRISEVSLTILLQELAETAQLFGQASRLCVHINGGQPQNAAALQTPALSNAPRPDPLFSGITLSDAPSTDASSADAPSTDIPSADTPSTDVPSTDVPDDQTVLLDHGIFLTVAENLISNAARFAHSRLTIRLEKKENVLCLTVQDDGHGFPDTLIQDGPKPFGKLTEDAGHFGMGLYTSQILCTKHGGHLKLENVPKGGAAATAFFGDRFSVSSQS